MNPELIREYDMALEALEAAAEAAGSDTPQAEARLSERLREARQSSSPKGWVSEWVTGPMARLDVLECLRRTLRLELSETERQIAWASPQRPTSGGGGLDLVAYRAALAARLEERAERTAAARQGLSRILAVALRVLAEEVSAEAQEGLAQVAGQSPLEAYGRLVQAAERLTGRLALPAFASEQLARLRAVAALARPQPPGNTPGGFPSVYGSIRPRPTLVVSAGLARS
jgi:hypothetical protein